MRERPTHFETFLIVEGSGPFPLDMLRYDHCIPDAEKDAAVMGRRERRVVRLKHFFREGSPFEPCIDRWRSFGWEVLEYRDALGKVKKLREATRG